SSNCSPGANRTPETTAWLRRPRSRSQGEGTLAGGVRTTIFDRHTTMDTAVQCVKRVHQLDLETLVYEREREQQSSRKHHISAIPHAVRETTVCQTTERARNAHRGQLLRPSRTTNAYGGRSQSRSSGPSPRTRGARPAATSAIARRRITPAHAGSTRGRRAGTNGRKSGAKLSSGVKLLASAAVRYLVRECQVGVSDPAKRVSINRISDP